MPDITDARRLAALREVERHSPYNRESDIPTDTPTAPDPEPAEPVSISQLHHMALCTNREVANLQDSVIALNRAIASLETRYSQLRREIPAPTTTPAQPQPANYLPVLTNRQYRALLDLLMCSDPWPIMDGQQGRWQHATIIGLADHDALVRGYDNWIVAYHEHYYRNDTTSTPNTDTPNTPSTPPNTAPEPARTFSEPLIVKWVNDLIEQARATLREAIANGLMEMADKAEKLGHDSQCVTALRTAEVRVRHRYWEQ